MEEMLKLIRHQIVGAINSGTDIELDVSVEKGVVKVGTPRVRKDYHHFNLKDYVEEVEESK